MSQFRPGQPTRHDGHTQPSIPTMPSQPLPLYAQPEWYEQPPPPHLPPPNTGNDWRYALRAILIILVVLFGGGGLFAGLRAVFQISPGITASSSGSQQDAGTPGSVGITQQSSYWTVTVNSFTTSTGDSIFSPRSGDIYVIVNVTVKNNDTVAHDANPASLFALRDAQGTQYDIAPLDAIHFFDGTVIPGQQLRGDIAYEVPGDMHSFMLQFQPSYEDTADIVQWNLSD